MANSNNWPEPISPAHKHSFDVGAMSEHAAIVALVLKCLGHKGRLMILCHLSEGERTVGELEALLNLRQATVSQMLARLRDDGQVIARRSGKAVYYALADERTKQVLHMLCDLYCAPALRRASDQLDT